jgi:D-glycero-D-manno-heptose 1,7-bisphosphate phosphatase
MVLSPGMLMLDRDGTVIRHIHYLTDPRQVELINGVADGLKEMSDLGISICIVTNQSVIGRGMATVERVAEVNKEMIEQLSRRGVLITDIKVCPHLPTDNCWCRKPMPEMAFQLMEDFSVAPSQVLMVGDSETDIEFGINAGVKTVLFSKFDNPVSKRDYFCQDWVSVIKIAKEVLCQRN